MICFIIPKLSAQPGIGISFSFSSLAGFSPYPLSSPNIQQIIPAADQDDFAYLFSPAGMNIKFSGVNYQKVIQMSIKI